ALGLQQPRGNSSVTASVGRRERNSLQAVAIFCSPLSGFKRRHHQHNFRLRHVRPYQVDASCIRCLGAVSQSAKPPSESMTNTHNTRRSIFFLVIASQSQPSAYPGEKRFMLQLSNINTLYLA